jgi:hypothetical protein
METAALRMVHCADRRGTIKISDFISANGSVPFAHATDLAQTADVELTGGIERWERGVPRQRTMTMSIPHKAVLVSRVDQ